MSCSACGKIAATFAAWRANEGEGFLRERDRLLRHGFAAEVTRPLAFVDAAALVAKVAAGELGPLAATDFDLFGFFCRVCARAYCEACWDANPPEFDDGFYDCTRATCPASHTQVIDD